jgi:hypothetical protein
MKKVPSGIKATKNVKREELVKLIEKNKDLNNIELSDKFKLSVSHIKYLCIKYGIKVKKTKNVKINYLKEAVLKYIKKNPDVSYVVASNRFGTSSSYVGRIARENGINKDLTETQKNEVKNEIAHIKLDVKLGLTYPDIKIKYKIDGVRAGVLKYYGLGKIRGEFIGVRNTEIQTQYKIKTASKLLLDTNIKLDSPQRITSLGGAYRIACRGGFKKYPNVGNRNKGGVFEDKKILKRITKRKDKDNWTFQAISDELQTLGYKTITGVEFSMANVIYKYHSYKKLNSKV